VRLDHYILWFGRVSASVAKEAIRCNGHLTLLNLWAPDSERRRAWASDSDGHLTLIQAIDLFLAAKGAEGISPKTATWYHGDAIGGSAGNKYAHTTLRMQNTQNGTWLSPSLNASNDCNVLEREPIFKSDITTSDGFQSWTER